jgi:hypothetical protein
MDHVLTGVVGVKKVNCYSIAVYCQVVLDEGKRRKKGFLCCDLLRCSSRVNTGNAYAYFVLCKMWMQRGFFKFHVNI